MFLNQSPFLIFRHYYNLFYANSDFQCRRTNNGSKRFAGIIVEYKKVVFIVRIVILCVWAVNQSNNNNRNSHKNIGFKNLWGRKVPNMVFEVNSTENIFDDDKEDVWNVLFRWTVCHILNKI